MKSRGIVTFLMAMPVCLGTSAAIYFSENFTSGKLPNTINVSDEDGIAYDTEVYGVALPEDGWMVSSVGIRGFAAVSPTRSLEAGLQKNRLSTAFFKVEQKGAVLRWAGKSILPAIAERYLVQVTEEGSGGFRTIAEVPGENYEWTFHSVSLDEFAGKKISVSFVTDSGDGYMIAIDDIMAGVPDDTLLVAENETPVYYGGVSEAAVRVKVTNFGKDINIDSFVCRNGSDNVGETSYRRKLLHGESTFVDVIVPLEQNVRMQYTVYAVDSETGKDVRLCTGDLFGSAYERTVLLDKATGMWCNNCPKGILTANEMKRRFGDNLVIVETHANPDRLECQEYWPGLKFYAVPYMMIDRNRQSAGELDNNFDRQLWTPVKAEIVPTSCDVTDYNAEVGFKVRFADDTDNASDRYRIGYVVTCISFSDEVKQIFYQLNSLTTPKYDEYYFLPSKIPSRLVDFHDVTVEGSKAFTGIENSLPDSFKADEYAVSSVKVTCPDMLDRMQDGRLVAYVLDTETGRVLNSAAVSFDGSWSTGVDEIGGDMPATAPVSVRRMPDGCFRLGLGAEETDFLFELHDMAGGLLFSQKGRGAGSVDVHADVLPGVTVATLRTAVGAVSAKIITK